MKLSIGPDSSSQSMMMMNEEALKDWVWTHHKNEIYKALQVKRQAEPTELELYKKRWELSDRVAHATQNFLKSEGPKVVYTCLLNGILELMQSKCGFIGEARVEDDGTDYIQIHATSAVGWTKSTTEFFDTHGKDLKFYNLSTLFGQVYTTRKPVISNDFERDKVVGCPKGHPPIENFLGLPLYKSPGDAIGILCIANKPGGYTADDIEFMEPFCATGSNLIQAYWQLEENNRLIDALEVKVQERTKRLKLANKSLAEANRHVVQASSEQMQHFACMSHEIRTPLNCIIGMSSLLQGTKMSPMQKESMDMITTSGNLLLNVVNDVLDFSKLATGNVDIDWQRSNLQETLDAVAHSIDMKARKRYMSLRTLFDAALPEYFETDPHRLQQILYNLLGNAVKFSNKGGEIEFSVKIVEANKDPQATLCDPEHVMQDPLQPNTNPGLPQEHIATDFESTKAGISKCPFHSPQKSGSVPSWKGQTSKWTIDSPTLSSSGCEDMPDLDTENTCQHDETTMTSKGMTGRFIRFAVRDYGKGIKKSDFERIFKPFRQANASTERLHGGTGLGLSITAKLVKALGGEISVDSEFGSWTEFTVDFPLGGVPEDPTKLGHGLGNASVLVVDSDTKNAAIVCETLGRCGIGCRKLASMGEVEAPPDQCSVCLVHEDLYDAERFCAISHSAKCTLITFGQAHSVTEASAHIRAPTALLPCVLVGTIQSALSATADEEVTDCESGTLVRAPSDTCEFRDLRVLVAEDNLINQKVMTRMLKRLGVEAVDMVDNGKKAVDMELAQCYDVVLMDMQMPVMCGVEATKSIISRPRLESQPRPKVVFVTANVFCGSEFDDTGAWDFLPKPFNLDTIRKCLQKVASAKYCNKEI